MYRQRMEKRDKPDQKGCKGGIALDMKKRRERRTEEKVVRRRGSVLIS